TDPDANTGQVRAADTLQPQAGHYPATLHQAAPPEPGTYLDAPPSSGATGPISVAPDEATERGIARTPDPHQATVLEAPVRGRGATGDGREGKEAAAPSLGKRLAAAGAVVLALAAARVWAVFFRGPAAATRPGDSGTTA